MATTLDAMAAGVRSKLDELELQYREIEAALQDPEAMSDHKRARELGIHRAALAPVAEGWREVQRLSGELVDLREAIAGDDAELAAMAADEIEPIEQRIESLVEEVKAALVGTEDRGVGGVILELRAGAGGDEAGLWTRDLLQMYERYAANKRWAFEVLDVAEDGGMGGVRSAVATIRGEGVWSELGFEAGVHSGKRVPATESQGRSHTSTSTVAVLPEVEETDVHIDWSKDVVEHVTTSQGPGGQNVNKVATAVHMVHEPTGVEVRMQESKSQHQNREKARRLLAARVAELERQKQHAARAAARSAQIKGGDRSEKLRVYRYQEGIVADQRLDQKYQLRDLLAGDLQPMMSALLEQETARKLADL